MLASPHLPRLRELRWPTLASRVAIPLVFLLFAGVFVLRMSDHNPGSAEGILFVVPIGVLALRFGLRGGLAGALIAFALVIAWGHFDHHVIVAPMGYVSRAVAFLTLGLLIGGFVEHRRGLEAEVLRYYEGSLDMLATASVNGYLTRVNPAWERALGHSAETLCGKPFLEFVHPDDREATIARANALVESSREIVGFRNRYQAADGSYRCLEWTASASSEGVIHTVARDVTVQQEAEDQLADNARCLETMVAERTHELDEARAETLRRLAIAAEYRDDETYQHTERVGAVAARIALGLGLPAGQIRILRQAAPLHDVGKLAIPDRILLKPGRLTPEEFEVMKTHAALGARLLTGSNSPVLKMAALIAATHHERWDGQGYPTGRAGEAIPMVGRVVAVADVFDALIHDRPYKSAWPLEKAIAEIERASGSQFDPRVVAAFLALDLGTGEAGNGNGRPLIDALSWNELVGSFG